MIAEYISLDAHMYASYHKLHQENGAHAMMVRNSFFSFSPAVTGGKSKAAWLSCSQEKMLQRGGVGLVAIQASTNMRPPDPDGVNPLATHAGALGSEGAAKDLLAKLDSMQAQVSLLLTSFVACMW